MAGCAVEFGGTGDQAPGYVNYDSNGAPVFRPVEIDGRTEFGVARLSEDATFRGQSAFLVELVDGERLGTIDQRFVHYRLELVGAARRTLGDLPILGHQGKFIFLERTRSLPANATSVRVLTKFFEVTSSGQPGLGNTRGGSSGRIPIANVQIGFAFHTDPRDGLDGRYPDPTHPDTLKETFVYDLTVQSFQDYLGSGGAFSYAGEHRPTFVQYDVLFNTRFDPDLPNNNSGLPLSADSPDLGIEDLRLPYRF